MARQQYNNRQIKAYQPSRSVTGGYSRYGGNHRNAPPPKFTEEKPKDTFDIRDVIIDWIEREMDPWYYSAMSFDTSHYMSSYSVSVRRRSKTSMTEGSYYSSSICGIDLKADRMIIVPYSYNNNHLSITTILYAEPELLEIMQHAIKVMYNCAPMTTSIG